MLRLVNAQTTDVKAQWVTEQLNFSTADIEQQIFYGRLSESRHLKIETPQPQMPGGQYVIVAGEPRLIIRERRVPLDEKESI